MRRFAIATAAFCFGQLFWASLAWGAWPESFRRDANLNDVCFIDRQTGWAVGDRGTILRTSDGGENWHLQTSPVDARLESIHALDADHGWAVGGFTTAYTHRSKGIILRTDDGGHTWTQTENHFLPWLTHIQFRDGQHGFATGFPSAMFPSGVFRTSDGGKHWTPWPGNTPGCIAGHFDENGRGLGLDTRGRPIRIEPQGLKYAGEDRPTPASQIRLISKDFALACGIQGYVATSVDRGQTWSQPEDLSRVDGLAEFDWRAIGSHGSHLWIAGVPGTRILYSSDQGASWKFRDTGQTLPLQAIDFVDTQNGWAVGSLGTILATSDGGQTWRRQTEGPSRLALMMVVRDPATIPWELLAQVSGSEGLLASVEVLSGPPTLNHDASAVPISRRLQEATTAVSGSSANIIQTVPTPDLTLKLSEAQLRQRLNDAIGGDSRQLLCEYLVRQIRMFRPEMLVVGDDVTRSPGAAAATHGLVKLAVQRANNATQFEQQIQHGGLQPWQAKSVAARTTDENGSVYRVTSTRLALPLGQSISHLADTARSIMSNRYDPGPDSLLVEIPGRQSTGRSRGSSRLFDSATLARGERMHRSDLTLKDNFRELHRHAQQRRTIESLLRSSEGMSVARLQQVSQLSRKLPPSDQGDLFYQTAYRLAAAKHQTEATGLLDQLATQLPRHALAESAHLQLLLQTASLEGLLHWSLPMENMTQPTTSGLKVRSNEGVQKATFEAATADESRAIDRQTISHRRSHRETRALEIAKTIQANQPDLYFEPMIRFPLAAIHRRLGRTDEASSYWRTQLARQSDRIWNSRAAAELALTKRNGRQNLLSHVCQVTKERPYLDGKLDEGTWSGEAIVLHADRYSKSLKTEVRWAWDDQFLFFAAQCPLPPASDRAPSHVGDRQRDVDLSDNDRLVLRLDIDRDYSTYWELTIDKQGSANDSLGHDRSWNPSWFFDTASNDHGWTVEAAIPWDQISPEVPRPGEAWAIGIDRQIPAVGGQGWGQAQPRQTERHQVGLLIFE